MAKSWANARSSKLKIELNEQDINVKFESTKGNSNSVWKHYYSNAGIFFKDHTPEIKLDPNSIRDGKVDVVKKAEIAPILRTNIFSKMWLFEEDSSRQEQLITASTIMIAIVLVLFVGTQF